MHWLALLSPPPAPTEEAHPGPRPQQQALAWWALQFTPRVAWLEEAVVLEVQASLRLFGGVQALHQRVLAHAGHAGLHLQGAAWAATSLGALARARCLPEQPETGLRWPDSRSVTAQLDTLPLQALSAVQAHAAMLARLGCKRLGDVRRLPRAALGRRFGQTLLYALDQAYGHLHEVHAWIILPEQFNARLELPQRSDNAMALLHHAEHLLRQLCAWLAARHAGVQHLELRWVHDTMRAREIASHGALQLRTAEVTRDFRHLAGLLHEHLLRLSLPAAVGEISLHAGAVLPLQEHSATLLLPSSSSSSGAASSPGSEPPQKSLPQLLERLAVRLGETQVRCGHLHEDHRLERMQRWQPWPGQPPRAGARPPESPQPSWLLNPPLRLVVYQDQPQYMGPLRLLAGPQRIEGGWWDDEAAPPLQQAQAQTQTSQHVQRDYFLALSAAAGVLWIFQQRLVGDESGWFLHGVFA
ncbi:Y-family DNA polymerase [Roseateles koreensis]|uniref:DNA polymerase Y family protein n=1 Tax=Roseateles koreensis TaxID=2987526 RepID=A0ABT5KSK5_9BURK|nr:DNA polymerase Y family protein [Roseateles koreensis]MDC8785832.1 DNA polymerase Y family protein [Roseateles koreensis]